ncbi:ATP-binding protein [Candidatus Woesearchaeota archaeon]|nr:ATP-binding protein [Candidatus Woesearchaeota archaeon]
MKSIIVLSGKGGVGKSSIAASLAVVMSRNSKIVCADCDVDASNLSLLFGLTTDKYVEWRPLSTNQEAVVDKEKCTGCGRCTEFCYFNALELEDGKPRLKKFGCEGCGVCELVCPEKAIKLVNIENAYVGYARSREGFFIASAQLQPGNSGSGKVVFEVKKKAMQIGMDADLMLIDAAAGIGCPVIASVAGADYAVLVIEPTPSGYADMLRALEIVDHFKIKKGIIINKHDLNKRFSEKIESFAKEKNINVLAKIPFDKNFVTAMTCMIPIIEYDKEYEPVFEGIRQKLMASLARG